ncbi:hypothetical protein [uncultured Clostridium sp.]|uniref:hypothetical protein n=1 Tax=uncultured Clostridium sp. TaxID=59620 RepID=UPI0026350A14|nr:hypothetical protein [uncultured Clostridium sp.]
MEKMRENISYIISEDDSDKIKMEKILKKFSEQKMKLFSKDITINSTDNNIVVSTLNFILQIEEEKEEIKYPYISSAENFNKNIFENIMAAKKVILFERLGIQPKLQETNTTQVVGTITPKQKELLIDKSRNDTNKIIENKLKEFGLSSIDELRKDQASKIIDCFPKRP